MGRKKASENTEILSFRVAESVGVCLRTLAARASQVARGTEIRPLLMARTAFLRGLDVLEGEFAEKRGKRQ